LLERIRKRADAGPLAFLVMDLRRVSGIDSSAAMAFVKAVRLAEAKGFELVLAGASEPVRAQLARGGVVSSDGVVRFEPDLDRALQRCEDALLEGGAGGPASLDGDRMDGDRAPGGALAEMPPGLDAYLERESLDEGAVLIHQDEAPDDVFVLESGRLSVEVVTAAGTRMRLRTIRPGVVVGEVAMYTGVPRTADVVAETPIVVRRLTKTSIERMQAGDPELAAALHRWLAGMLAERLGDTLKVFDALID
jgi:sulfate permease, SulP family